MSDLNAADRRWNGELQLGQKDVSRCNLVARGFDFGNSQFAASARDDYNRVLARGVVDQDRWRSAGLFRILENMTEAHALVGEKLGSHIAKSISAKFCDQMDISIKASRRDRLV